MKMSETYDKARSQLEDNELLLNCDLPALLIADDGAYHMISDDDLLKYLKGAVRRFKTSPSVVRSRMLCGGREITRIVYI